MEVYKRHNPFKWTQQQTLNNKAREYYKEKRFDEAEEILLKALHTNDSNLQDLHFVYNSLIQLYYRLRNERYDAIENCIYYCKEDIERLPSFLKGYKREYGDIPDCPSTKMLIRIYEKDKKYKEAIELCNYAIDLGLEKRFEWYNKQYGKNKGYKARIVKLQKKLEEG